MVQMPAWVTSPDPNVVERVTLLNMLGIADDPNLSIAELRDRTAAGADVESAVRIAGYDYDDFTGFMQEIRDFKTKFFLYANDYGAVGDGVANDTTAIQALANASSGRVVVFDANKTYKISAPILWPANVTITTFGGRATIKHSVVNLGSFYTNNTGYFEVNNMVFIGIGTEYVSGAQANSIAISVTNNTRVSLYNNAFYYHAGGCFRAQTGVTNIKISRCYMEGTQLLLNNIIAGDPFQCGIYVGGSCSGVEVDTTEICYMSMGITSSIDTTRQRYSDLNIHDIAGQHGLYLQNGNNLKVSAVKCKAINYNGIKVQLGAATTGDSSGTQISNIQGDGVMDTLVVLSNTSISGTDAAFVYKHRNASINNILNQNGSRTIYFEDVRVASVTNITTNNNNSDDITLIDCQEVLVDGFLLENAGRNGIRMATKTGGQGSGIRICNGRIKNPAQQSVVGQQYGIYQSDGTLTDMYCWNVDIEDTTNKMVYGFFFSVGVQAGCRLRDMTVKGSNSNQDIRFKSATEDLGEFTNVSVGSTVLNMPTTLPVKTGGGTGGGTYMCSAAPTKGFYLRSATCWNSVATVGQPRGWMNTNQGGSYSGSWAATTVYAVGQWMRTSTGKVIECTVAGTSGAVEPAPAAVNDVIVDGTVTWVCRATSLAVWTSMGVL